MATKESEDMESLCLRQNRRFHILRFSPNDGISVLLICLIFSGINKCVISSVAPIALFQYASFDVSPPALQRARKGAAG